MKAGILKLLAAGMILSAQQEAKPPPGRAPANVSIRIVSDGAARSYDLPGEVIRAYAATVEGCTGIVGESSGAWFSRCFGNWLLGRARQARGAAPALGTGAAWVGGAVEPGCRLFGAPAGGWNEPGTRLPLRASLVVAVPEWMKAPVQRAWRAWRAVVPGQDDDESPNRIVVSATAIDGPGLVMARTYFPGDVARRRGRVVVDSAEDWGGAHDLYSVMLHELGHAIGLRHSGDRGAVMWWRYRRRTGLGWDDIMAAWQLYRVTPRAVRVVMPPD